MSHENKLTKNRRGKSDVPDGVQLLRLMGANEATEVRLSRKFQSSMSALPGYTRVFEVWKLPYITGIFLRAMERVSSQVKTPYTHIASVVVCQDWLGGNRAASWDWEFGYMDNQVPGLWVVQTYRLNCCVLPGCELVVEDIQP